VVVGDVGTSSSNTRREREVVAATPTFLRRLPDDSVQGDHIHVHPRRMRIGEVLPSKTVPIPRDTYFSAPSTIPHTPPTTPAPMYARLHNVIHVEHVPGIKDTRVCTYMSSRRYKQYNAYNTLPFIEHSSSMGFLSRVRTRFLSLDIARTCYISRLS